MSEHSYKWILFPVNWILKGCYERFFFSTSDAWLFSFKPLEFQEDQLRICIDFSPPLAQKYVCVCTCVLLGKYNPLTFILFWIVAVLQMFKFYPDIVSASLWFLGAKGFTLYTCFRASHDVWCRDNFQWMFIKLSLTIMNMFSTEIKMETLYHHLIS